ncbi:MAG: 50S ribosomal protein L25/general stress protein Ctc [Cytophagales bacterium]|nr:50S ribosomal protein L25/general stress protein Ctc [Cytophagales bacterium]MDW8383409.1 50S ribosomal protein L25/general stress protein Ctc [Flammeovirgaceae bacterium]
MKSLDMIGYYRHQTGKRSTKDLRKAANVPCVMYGGEKLVHFYSPMFLFNKLVYTPEVHIINLNIEGDKFRCILQDVQFHPVSEIILHADFLELRDNKPVKIEVPIKIVGNAIGVQKGGRLLTKLRKVRIKALPANLPDYVEIDVTNLDLGKNIRVGDIKTDKFEILNTPTLPVASVEVPRGLRGQSS